MEGETDALDALDAVRRDLDAVRAALGCVRATADAGRLEEIGDKGISALMSSLEGTLEDCAGRLGDAAAILRP